MTIKAQLDEIQKEHIIYSNSRDLYDSTAVATKNDLFFIESYEIDEYRQIQFTLRVVSMDVFDKKLDSWVNIAEVNSFCDANWENKPPKDLYDRAMFLTDIFMYHGTYEAEVIGDYNNIDELMADLITQIKGN